MAIVQYSYCNTSLGKTITLSFNNVTNVVTNGVVGSDCNSPQPNVVGVVYGTGFTILGNIVPQNTFPYGRYISLLGACTLSISSIVITNSSTNLSNNGTITINVTGGQFSNLYSINGGLTFQNSNIFTNLKFGNYNVFVRTGNNKLCFDTEVVSVGFSSFICDLSLGSIITEPANGSTGKIKVLNISGYPSAVQYRLGVGAWQDSAEFTGLISGTYNVQVRFKFDNTCVDSRAVIVGETSSCDLYIVGVNITHERSKYADDGIIEIVAQSSFSGIEYSKDNGLTYQSSSAFANLSPGTYELKVRDSNACLNTLTVQVFKYKSPVIVMPIVNSYRVVLLSAPFILAGQKQNFDNRLFEDMKFSGVTKSCYHQKAELGDIITYQFRSNYATNVVKLYKNENVLVSFIDPVKRSANLNKTEVFNILAANFGANKTQLFFETGVPVFFEIGLDITITTQASLNGVYEIKDIAQGTGQAEGYQVLVIDKIYTSGTPILPAVATLVYDLEPYEVYEFILAWAAYGIGKYYFTVEGTDPQFASYFAKSEPIEIKEFWNDTVQLKYKNSDNAFKILYDTGIDHLIRVEGDVSEPMPGGKRTVYEDSRHRLIKVQENITRNPVLSVYSLPVYLLEKISIILAMDFIEIDGVEYQTQEDFEPEYFKNDSLHNGKAKLRQVDFVADNSDDAGESDVDILGTTDTLLGVS
jgi:hypothetical protein